MNHKLVRFFQILVVETFQKIGSSTGSKHSSMSRGLVSGLADVCLTGLTGLVEARTTCDEKNSILLGVLLIFTIADKS